MTFWDTVLAVLWAGAIFRLLDFGTQYVVNLYRQKKIDRILDELDEFWAEQAAAAKPVRKKKAVAKKK
jgi:hypothetical protein